MRMDAHTHKLTHELIGACMQARKKQPNNHANINIQHTHTIMLMSTYIHAVHKYTHLSIRC